MKSVCAKHEQAYEDSCPYCEKKAEGPTAAAAAPVNYGPCARKAYFIGPGPSYFDGRGYQHTIVACRVTP